MTEWKKMTIGDLCDTISDTYHGDDEEVVLINTSDVLEGKVLNHQVVENKNLKGQFKKTFKKNDILYSEIRPANKRYAFIDFEDTENYIASTKLMVLRPREDVVRPRFLLSFLSSKSVLEDLQQLAEMRSGTFPQITFSSELAPTPIDVPDLETQDRIVRILDVIEKKISTNMEINNNLEQQVTTAFYNMFGKYEQISNTHKPLSTIAKFKYGTMPKKDKLGTGHYHAFSGYQIVGTYPEVMFENPQLIIVARGVGGCGDVKYTPANCYLTNLSIAIITEKTMHDDYLYHYLRLHDTKIMNTGSAQPQITVATLEKIEIPIPPEEEMIRFSDFVQPFKQQYRNNQDENKLLSKLRDTLLSKLMSGELDISDIDI